MLSVAAVGVALIFGTLGLEVVYKLESVRSLALIQIVILVDVPVDRPGAALVAERLAARGRAVELMTNILRMARQGFVGEVTWHDTWPGMLAITLLVAGLGRVALRGLRRFLP